MAKRKYPSELNTRTIRVNIGDWQMLLELSRKYDTTVAGILHLAITNQAAQKQITIPRAQVPMPIFQVAPRPVMAANGHKPAVLIIKPKGGVIANGR